MPPVCYRASWQLPGPDSTGKRRRTYEHDTIDDLELIAAPRVLLDPPQIGYSRGRLRAISFVAFVYAFVSRIASRRLRWDLHRQEHPPRPDRPR